MNTRFSSVGKFVVGFLTGVAALAVILQWYYAPKGDLRAAFQVNAFETPPKMDSIAGAGDLLGGKARTYLTGRIENGGSKEIKQVTLRLPNGLYACIGREPSGWKCQGASTVVAIGDLSPLESADVKAWLGAHLFDADFDAIKLTHSEGVGRLSYDTVQTPPGFWPWPVLFGLVAGLVGITAAQVFLFYKLARVTRRRRHALDANDDLEPPSGLGRSP